MARHELAELSGTRWTGAGELWIDPQGDDAHRYPCELRIDSESVRYTWTYEGKEHEGTITLTDGGATWCDTWHQQQPVECVELPEVAGLLVLHCTYPAPDGPDWGWRTTLSRRPTGELVLQMTNIAPWGEEARAVRMNFTRNS